MKTRNFHREQITLKGNSQNLLTRFETIFLNWEEKKILLDRNALLNMKIPNDGAILTILNTSLFKDQNYILRAKGNRFLQYLLFVRCTHQQEKLTWLAHVPSVIGMQRKAPQCVYFGKWMTPPSLGIYHLLLYSIQVVIWDLYHHLSMPCGEDIKS